jgi:hypothetical protein
VLAAASVAHAIARNKQSNFDDAGPGNVFICFVVKNVRAHAQTFFIDPPAAMARNIYLARAATLLPRQSVMHSNRNAVMKMSNKHLPLLPCRKQL